MSLIVTTVCYFYKTLDKSLIKIVLYIYSSNRIQIKWTLDIPLIYSSVFTCTIISKYNNEFD
jgi:hypothetical protein